MLNSDYDGQVCSVARALELVGERWTLLVIRDAFMGISRFDDFQAGLGIARNVLTTRLDRLVAAGIMEKRPYQQHPLRHEYVLTDKGDDLWPVLHSLMRWGDEHSPNPAGPPTIAEHRDCGGTLGAGGACERCGEVPVSARGVRARPGPGASPAHPLLRAAARREVA